MHLQTSLILIGPCVVPDGGPASRPMASLPLGSLCVGAGAVGHIATPRLGCAGCSAKYGAAADYQPVPQGEPAALLGAGGVRLLFRALV